MSLSHHLRQRLTALAVGALILIAVTAPGSRAGDRQADRIALNQSDEPIRLLVQLRGAPLADRGVQESSPAALQELRAEQDSFRGQLRQAGIRYVEHGSYTRLFNGLSIEVAAQDRGRVAGLRGAGAVFLSVKTELPSPDLSASTGMIGTHQAWAGDPTLAIPGVDGRGIRVAVIDTGMSYGDRT